MAYRKPFVIRLYITCRGRYRDMTRLHIWFNNQNDEQWLKSDVVLMSCHIVMQCWKVREKFKHYTLINAWSCLPPLLWQIRENANIFHTWTQQLRPLSVKSVIWNVFFYQTKLFLPRYVRKYYPPSKWCYQFFK